MDFPLKIFQSLNCSQCNFPFSKNANDRKGPRKFPICGLTVCSQCFKDIKRQRQQQRDQSHGCNFDNLTGCRFDDVEPAYFLIELLNNPAIVESPNGNGYYLTKQFDIPECVICHEEDSLETGDRKPCDLMCNHTICLGCVKKTNRYMNFSQGPQYYTMCPVCTAGSRAFDPSTSWRANSLMEFLIVLPEMTKQLAMIEGQKGLQQLESRKVDEVDTGKRATKLSPTIEITDRFDCSECVSEICGSCVVRRHREHKLTDLFVKETCRISEETKQMVSIQIDGYKKIFPGLHQQLVERIASFEKVLVGKAEEIANLENLEKTKDEVDQCKGYAEKFEEISEEYLPNLRSFDTSLQNLIDKLKNAKISKNEAEKK